MREFDVEPQPVYFDVEQYTAFEVLSEDYIQRFADNLIVVRNNPWVIISRENYNLYLIRLADNLLFKKTNDNPVIERH